MDNRETLATQGTQDKGRRQAKLKKHTTQKTKKMTHTKKKQKQKTNNNYKKNRRVSPDAPEG